MSASVSVDLDSRYLSELTRWRAERESTLAEPHGWLSVVGLFWIGNQPTAIKTVAGTGFPGLYTVAGESVRLTAEPDPERSNTPLIDLRAGVPARAGTSATVPEGLSLFWLEHGAVVAELIRRTHRWGIRLRDANAASRTEFAGVPTFEPHQKWLLPGTFARFIAPELLTVGAAQPGLEHHLAPVGSVTFTIDGAAQRLVAFDSGQGGLQVPFFDSTNRDLTAPWRTLTVGAPDDEGNVHLDFNRAINLPFAFSDFGTCPKPPPDNVVDVAVTAGEMRPARIPIKPHHRRLD